MCKIKIFRGEADEQQAIRRWPAVHYSGKRQRPRVCAQSSRGGVGFLHCMKEIDLHRDICIWLFDSELGTGKYPHSFRYVIGEQ